jgi:hypothetical protein
VSYYFKNFPRTHLRKFWNTTLPIKVRHVTNASAYSSKCGKKYVCPIKTTLDRSISFISDISIVSYNIRLTMIGQLATLLSTSHTSQIFIQSCLTFKRTGAWGKSWSRQIYICRPNILANPRPNIYSILSTKSKIYRKKSFTRSVSFEILFYVCQTLEIGRCSAQKYPSSRETAKYSRR